MSEETKKYEYVLGLCNTRIGGGKEHTFVVTSKISFRPERLAIWCDDPKAVHVKSFRAGVPSRESILLGYDPLRTAERFAVVGGGMLDAPTNVLGLLPKIRWNTTITIVIENRGTSSQSVKCAVLGEAVDDDEPKDFEEDDHDDECEYPDGGTGEVPMPEGQPEGTAGGRQVSSLFEKAKRWFERGFEQAVADRIRSRTIMEHYDESGSIRGMLRDGPIEQLGSMVTDLLFFLHAPLKLALNSMGDCEHGSPSSPARKPYSGPVMHSILGLCLVAAKKEDIEDGKILPGRKAILTASPQTRFRCEMLRLFGDLKDLSVTDIKVGRNSQLGTSDPVEARAFDGEYPMNLDDCPISMGVQVFLHNRGGFPASISGVMRGVNLGCD